MAQQIKTLTQLEDFLEANHPRVVMAKSPERCGAKTFAYIIAAPDFVNDNVDTFNADNISIVLITTCRTSFCVELDND